jgi:hypothetical protein
VKKIVLVCLALVIALGAMGFSYAMWSDTVTITSTIHTGDVELGLLNLGTSDDGVTDSIVWCDGTREISALIGTGSADPQCGIGANPDRKGFASLVSTNGTANADCSGYYEDITETFANVYPFYMGSTAIEIKNCGTIPLNICDIEANYTGGALPTDKDLVPWMDFSLCIEGSYLGRFNTLDDLAVALLTWFRNNNENLQIEPGEDVEFQLDICFDEEADQIGDDYPGVVMGQIMPQGATASYSIVITGCQWNETLVDD